MTKSSELQQNIKELLEDGKDYSIVRIKDYLDKKHLHYTEGQFSGSINTLVRNQVIIKKGRGIYALNDEGGERYCFVISPIGSDGSEVRKNADTLFNFIIKPVCSSCGLKVERVDQINDCEAITKVIIDKLEKADLVIADITGYNPNVFYEMGYRRCTGKPIIHLKSKGEKIPFDINDIRTIEYDLHDLALVEKVKEQLKSTISNFSFKDINKEKEKIGEKKKDLKDIFTILDKMQDSLREIKEQVKYNDKNIGKDENRSDKLEMLMLNLLLPEFIKEPKYLKNLLEVSEIVNKPMNK